MRKVVKQEALEDHSPVSLPSDVKKPKKEQVSPAVSVRSKKKKSSRKEIFFEEEDP